MAKYVVANSESAWAADNAIRELVLEGVPRACITLVANPQVAQGLGDMRVQVVNDLDNEADEESFGQRVKEFFGFGHDREDKGHKLPPCRQDIHDGRILVVVDDMQMPTDIREKVLLQDANYWYSVRLPEKETVKETAAETT